MLTQAQKTYILKIPEDSLANIKPWDGTVACFAKDLVEELHSATSDLEILWSGSLALGILGENDIDLTFFAEPNNFEKYLSKLAFVLGDPQIKGEEKILWRTKKEGQRIDAYLGSKNSDEIKSQIRFFESLSSDKDLLKEYEILKKESVGKTLREYQERKCEFYNNVLGIK